jgi:Na+/H+ antiporter NhaD/arsenite permease-like protein
MSAFHAFPALLASSSPHPTPEVSIFWMLPFALLLASIAVMPLAAPHFWHKRYPVVAIGLGLITAIYYLFLHDDLAASRPAWIGEMKEYVSFICLLGSLFIVSGGIVINVTRKAAPSTNAVLLIFGAVLANVVGTTGAAMLLIRPFLRINKDHLKPYHVVFFIFIIANCGGALTPIGDPPLFMGYLKGVPFLWVAEHLLPMWAMTNFLLVAIFFIIDEIDHRKSIRSDPKDPGPALEIVGFHNFVFIGLILVAVFRPSIFESHGPAVLFSREVLMVAAIVLSKLATKRIVYDRNEFSFGPIKEVAILFVGIFSTMVPALNYLTHHADRLGLKTPAQYYFVTGALSSVLDNAPTYLVFFAMHQAQVQEQLSGKIEALRAVADNHSPGMIPTPPDGTDPRLLAAYKSLIEYNRAKIEAGTVTEDDVRIAAVLGNPEFSLYLIAISVGAVFFGAMTYIGNGPNFMVKSIAESAGVRMPSFFGYVFRYALPILFPVLLLNWLVFFR